MWWISPLIGFIAGILATVILMIEWPKFALWIIGRNEDYFMRLSEDALASWRDWFREMINRKVGTTINKESS